MFLRDSDFKIVALPYEPFRLLFSLNQQALRHHGARRMTVETHPGYPCRVSLQDAAVGETVLLINFTHHRVDSPYQASGPVFVRQNARQAVPGINKVPAMLRHRLLSLRAYDSCAMMIAAEVVEGTDVETHIRRFFVQETVAYLHIHNAMPGCFNCAVQRV